VDNNLPTSENNDSLKSGEYLTSPKAFLKKVAIFFIIVLNVIFLSVIVYLYLQNNNLKGKLSSVEKLKNVAASPYPEGIPVDDVQVGLSRYPAYSLDSGYNMTYRQEDLFSYKIDIPSNFEPASKPWSVRVNTLDEIRKIYGEAKKEGCPGTCSTLIEGDNLEKQFEILAKVADLKDCVSTEEIVKDIENFILFDRGPGVNNVIATIYNENLEDCGLKIIGLDGYDYFLGNYTYKAGFLKDNKIVEIRFELFPIGKFMEIDEIWKSMGYDPGSGVMVNSENFDVMENFMNNIDFEAGVVKKVINIYDNSVKSFELITAFKKTTGFSP